MANRVLIGKTATGVYGVKVSKPGIDVTSGADKDMLFNSTSVRTGLIYAGGSALNFDATGSNPSESTGQNFLTTGSKANLGYIPLVVFSEKNQGELEEDDTPGGVYIFVTNRSIWKTTSSTVTPCSARTAEVTSNSLQGVNPADGRAYDDTPSSKEDAINVSFFVLRIPCAFGYMNNTYFG